MNEDNLTYAKFKLQSESEQISEVFSLYEENALSRFENIRKAKDFFRNLVFDETTNDFIRLKGLKIVLWCTLTKQLNTEFAYDLFTDVEDNHPFLTPLKIKGLFLLGSEKESTITIFNKLKDHEDAEIASEAYYNYGLTYFFSNGLSADITDFISNLSIAENNFDVAISIVENRKDASIFSDYAQILKKLATKDFDAIEEQITVASVNLFQYQLLTLDNKLPILDLKIFNIIENAYKILKSVSEVDNWYDFRAELTKLNHYFFEILNVKLANDFFTESIYKTWKDKLSQELINPYLSLNLQAKISAIINMRSSIKASEKNDDLVLFLDRIIAQVSTPKKKDNTVVSIEIETLSNLFPKLSTEEIQQELQKVNQLAKNNALELIASLNLIDKSKKVEGIVSPIEREIIGNIRGAVENRLKGKKFQDSEFYKILSYLIRYVSMGYRRNDGIYQILYNNPNASENEFQDSLFQFLSTSKDWDNFEMEKQQFADGGRIDIAFSDKKVTIPIEIKKTTKNFDKTTILESFLPQAQTYVTPYSQVGFFVLFDARKKEKSIPNTGIRNLFWVDSIPSASGFSEKYPDLMVVVIIPANKYSPSIRSTYG